MNNFRVLDASIPSDREEWIKLWKSWKEAEPAGHPDYNLLFSKPQDQVFCAYARDDSGEVFFPLICRSLSNDPWAAGETVYDLITAYGYGGPFKMGQPNVATLFPLLASWANSKNIVSLFARLSLFPSQ